MEDAYPVHALADPGQDDLQCDVERDGEREKDAPLAEPGGEGEQKEDDGPEEDQVAEAGVETEAVVECLLADHPALIRPALIAKLLRGVEGSVRGACDLRDDGQPQDRGPVAIDCRKSLHRQPPLKLLIARAYDTRRMKLEVVEGDIAALEVEAVANAAN